MQNFKQYIFNPICLSCGSFFVKEHLFCEDCFIKKIFPQMSMKVKPITKDQNCYYLFEWVPFESDLLSETVYRMKSNKCCLSWKYYAAKLADSFANSINLDDVDYIVPVPGSKATSVHSYVFAHALGQELRKPVLNILTKTRESAEQKRKSKAERLNKTIQVHEQFTPGIKHLKLEGKHVLIVDDILTTGGSFNQSVAALGSVRKATLLTLFYRTTNLNTGLVS
jgi:predicted amidophosphoribosyltransferase